jgi:two-component system, OmpR family, sensor histidine kinase KdpD
MNWKALDMQKMSLQLLGMLVLLTIVTVANYIFFSSLGITGVTLLNLLVVVTAAYCCEFIVASSTAFLAFLTINYFFTEPRYTFEVAHVESLTSLICFLIVSMVITSLVKQLKFQTHQASIATKYARFGRTLAESLALATEVKSLLQDTCNLLQVELDKPFAIVLANSAQTLNDYTVYSQSSTIELPDSRLLNWVSTNGQPISPYTDYWSNCAYWLIPFSRMPNQDASLDPILVVANIDNEDNQHNSIEMYNAIKSCVDQVSLAYQRLINIEKAKQAEFRAQEEAIQNALLASISHDMRTPLTSILGAATTLQQSNLDAKQIHHLSALIVSQARYLASTTENILSLIRLESTQTIPLDWQSPEEIIGVVTTLYKDSGETVDLKVSVSEPELLIKGNASLLTQALVNLIDNAKQADIHHQPIEIDVIKTDNCINISVNDHGSGFGKTFDISQIKKFSSGSTKGFGLGLSIVQAIAKSHDAIFTIHNRESGGVCATLSFHALDVGNIDV